MSGRGLHPSRTIVLLVQVILLASATRVAGQLHLGSEELVQAGGADIDVPGYSVPSFVHWDEDDLEDLVIGEGSGTYIAQVRVYLNVGTASVPQFSTYFLAQSEGADLIVPGSG